MKRKYLAYAILPVLALALVGGVTYAATPAQERVNPFSNIAAAIAKKFNLNSNDVQTVIDETMAADRAQMEVNRETREDTRLAQAVTDGKLTQAQADLIKAKRAELQTAFDNLKNLSATDRQTAIKNQFDALKQWATVNNIPEQYLMFGGFGRGHGMGMGMGGRHGFGMWGNTSTTLPAANQ